jgi:hypothetical protein
MLEIGQKVYTVCGLRINPDNPPFRYKIYVSEKEITAISPDGSVYTAGKHDELQFHLSSKDGLYRSINKPHKIVFRDKQAAEHEKNTKIKAELSRRRKQNVEA